MDVYAYMLFAAIFLPTESNSRESYKKEKKTPVVARHHLSLAFFRSEIPMRESIQLKIKQNDQNSTQKHHSESVHIISYL